MKVHNVSIAEYDIFLKDIKDKIQNARVQASRVVNRELTLLYWSIGKKIVLAQKEYQWGEAIVEQLSRDLMKAFPGRAGFSTRNLWLMRKFYIEYDDYPILQTLSAEIAWSQNLAILNQVLGEQAREYY
ncbi:MAG TPA: DUF1016 N-terminal domain-containing protein, partial [Gammaproteobacteria bacterium]|nr:DUF1016 N-terminal domain-containing protein [Gammaproteobacteria bacterium]